MKNIDPKKSNSNQPPQIYICLVVSLSPQWLLICSKKKKIKWPTTPQQTQPWPTTPKPNPAIADHSKPSQIWLFSCSSSVLFTHYEAMAEAILYGAAQKIIKNLGSQIFQEIGLLWGVRDELEKLKNTISTIQAVLQHATEKQSQNHQAWDWL